MIPWVRLYSCLNRNPKWLSLPLYARSVWCSLLMLAGDEDRNGDVSEVALATRMGVPGRVLSESLRLFTEREWVTRESLASGERVVRVSGWSQRQYPSDLSKLRQANYRKRRASATESDGHCDVTRDVTVTVQTQKQTQKQTQTEHPLTPPASGEPSLFPLPFAQPQPEAPKKKRRSRNDPKPASIVDPTRITPEFRCVWTFWIGRRKKPESTLITLAALVAFEERTKEGFDVATLRWAIAGVEASDYFSRSGNDTFSFLLADSERVQQLAPLGKDILDAEKAEELKRTPTAERTEIERVRKLAKEMEADYKAGQAAWTVELLPEKAPADLLARIAAAQVEATP